MSESELPSLHALFARWRPGLEQMLPRHPTSREALPVVRDLLERLHEATAAGLTGRHAQFQQLHELLLAALAGTLSAVHAPAAEPVQTVDTPGRRVTLGPVTVSVRLDEPRRRAIGTVPGQPAEGPVSTTPRPAASPRVDWPALLDQLGAALEAADRVFAEAEQAQPERVRAPWASDTELMELFQDLLTAGLHEDGALALEHIRRLRHSLALHHDVDMVEYSEHRDALFVRAPRRAGPDDQPHLTLKPALVSTVGDRRLLVQGEARGPAPRLADGSGPADRGERLDA